MSTPPTILLAAHGAGTGSDANAIVEQLAQRLRVRRPELTFLPAYNLGEPRFPDAVTRAAGSDLLVVPLMMGRGYFVDERLPAELALSPHFAATRVRIAAPVGSVPLVVDDVIARTLRACDGKADVTVLVVGHGTTRSRVSRSSAVRLADELSTRLPADADVRAVFLDESPLLEDVAPTLAGRSLVVVPWLLGGGGHAKQDIAERLGDAIGRAVVLPPLGELPVLDDAVLQLVDELTTAPPVTPAVPTETA